jgi:hypothetical protein
VVTTVGWVTGILVLPYTTPSPKEKALGFHAFVDLQFSITFFALE